jgi:NAD(P)-dependent dehydrogenase (short-subunit alcohol dehydrogenase family)
MAVRVLLLALLGMQGCGAFVAPAAGRATLGEARATARARLHGRSPAVRMSSEAEPLTRRETLTRGALGAAGLVLGKKFFDGGSWTGTPDLTGRTVVVTGGNTGLGRETCLRLAKLGANVVVGSRSAARGTEAANFVAQAAGTDKVSSIVLDLADLKSVEAFAAAFQADHDRLDMLVNNAGVMAIPTREETANGFEKQLGINHFGHFHLTNLLMPQLKAAGAATGDARVINLSSQVGGLLRPVHPAHVRAWPCSSMLEHGHARAWPHTAAVRAVLTLFGPHRRTR